MKLKTMYAIMIMLVILAIAGCSNNAQSNPTGNVVSESPGLNSNPDKVTIYFFWGDGCPHCAHEKPFLEELEEKYGEDIEVKMFETYYNQDNVALFQQVAKAYGTRAQGVPTTFIGEEHWVGYADYMGDEIESKIKDCLENGCINPGDKLN